MHGRPPAACATHATCARWRCRRAGRRQRQGPARRAHPAQELLHSCQRIIPCLDVRDGQVVKGVRFRDHRVVGDILELARATGTRARTSWCSTTSRRAPRAAGRSPMGLARGRVLDIPFCVAGGIRSVEEAEACCCGRREGLRQLAGLERPALIERSRALRRAVRGGRHRQPDHAPMATACSNSPATSSAPATRPAAPSRGSWRRRARRRRDRAQLHGERRRAPGLDIAQLRAVRDICSVPLVASGGAGARSISATYSERADVDAALAASVFHSGDIAISDSSGGCASAA